MHYLSLSSFLSLSNNRPPPLSSPPYSGLKRLQAIILGVGAPNIVIEKASVNTDSLILSPCSVDLRVKGDNGEEDLYGEEGFYF